MDRRTAPRRTPRAYAFLAALGLSLAATAAADGPKNCLVVHTAPRCEDATCSNRVCDFRPSCCTTTWDQACVDIASTECQGCGLTVDSCFVEHAKPGCRDSACCATVCADPDFAYCCSLDWDFSCALRASDLCSSTSVPCGTPNSGSCSQPHGTPSCDNAACCETVCGVWPTCCQTAWDSTCVTLSLQLCAQVCNPGCPTGSVAESEACRSLTNDPIYSPGPVPGTPQSLAPGATVCGVLAASNANPPKNDVDVYLVDLRTLDTDGDGKVKVRLRLNAGFPMFAALVPVNSAAATLAASTTLRSNGGGCQEELNWACRAPGLWWVVVAAGVNGVITDAPTECTAARYTLKIEAEAACATACGASTDSCFTPHAGTSCNNAACCNATCAVLPQCCDIGWDQDCAVAAAENCSAPAPANNACGAPRAVDVGSTEFNTLGATLDGPATPSSCRDSGGSETSDVWFIWTPNGSGETLIATCGVEWDTRLELFTGACGSLVRVACSDDSAFCAPASSRGSLLFTEVDCDTTYRIRISGVSGAIGFGTLVIEAPNGPNCCPADLDQSGFIDNSDVAILLLDFGPCPGCPSDLDGSGTVDFGDAAVLMLDAGPCS